MIHGAFCGGWVFDAWRAVSRPRAIAVHTPTLRYHDGGEHPPRASARPACVDYAADLEKLIDGAANAADPGRPFHGRVAGADAGGAAKPRARWCCWRRRAPWGVLPSTLFEIGAAQALYLAGEFWNMALRARRIGSPPPMRWTCCPKASATRSSRASCRNRAAPRSRSCIGGSISTAPRGRSARR